MRYDEKRHNEAKRLWAEGMSLKQIAEEMHVTRSSICSYVARHREDFPLRHAPAKNEMTGSKLRIAKKMWSKGESIKRIANKTGLSAGYIGAYASLHRYDFPRRYKSVRMNAENMRTIRSMYEEGMTMRRIASELGCSPMTVSRVVHGTH